MSDHQEALGRLRDDYSDALAGQPHVHDAAGRRRGPGEITWDQRTELCQCGAEGRSPAPHAADEGYLVPTDALERLERLVAVLSEPLVAYTAELAAERDRARQEARQAQATANRLLKAVQAMVDAWPPTSWVQSTEARDYAVALLDEIAEGATMGSPEQPTEQGAPQHAAYRDTQPPADADDRPAG